MANRSKSALAAVERLLKRNKTASPEQIRAAAEKADASITKVNQRQFNAQYALPTKRRLGLTKTRTKGSAPSRKTARRTRRTHLTGQALARELVHQRDQEVRDILVANKDAAAGYQLAASVDEFLNDVQKALGS